MTTTTAWAMAVMVGVYAAGCAPASDVDDDGVDAAEAEVKSASVVHTVEVDAARGADLELRNAVGAAGPMSGSFTVPGVIEVENQYGRSAVALFTQSWAFGRRDGEAMGALVFPNVGAFDRESKAFREGQAAAKKLFDAMRLAKETTVRATVTRTSTSTTSPDAAGTFACSRTGDAYQCTVTVGGSLAGGGVFFDVR